MPLYLDQMGREVAIPPDPDRIISLVPSQTELLFHLGLEERVAGITKFCIHPDHWFRTKKRIGGTKTFHLDAIRALQPQLIIANKEENVQEQVETLASEFPVWISDINNFEDALDMIRKVGVITSKASVAEVIAMDIEHRFAESTAPSSYHPTVCYLIWKDPYMSVGHDTFIHHMLLKAGFSNAFGHLGRYPQLSVEDIIGAKPDLLFLSSEPYPFGEKHIEEWTALLPDTKIVLVDGEMFSWYGSRLLHAAQYFSELKQKIALMP